MGADKRQHSQSKKFDISNQSGGLFGLDVNNEVKRFYNIGTCGLYYKPMTIVNDDSRVNNKLEILLTDDARVVIYDRHVFIVQATGLFLLEHSSKYCLYQ